MSYSSKLFIWKSEVRFRGIFPSFFPPQQCLEVTGLGASSVSESPARNPISNRSSWANGTCLHISSKRGGLYFWTWALGIRIEVFWGNHVLTEGKTQVSISATNTILIELCWLGNSECWSSHIFKRPKLKNTVIQLSLFAWSMENFPFSYIVAAAFSSSLLSLIH